MTNLLPLEIFTNGKIIKIRSSEQYHIQVDGSALLEYVSNDNLLLGEDSIHKKKYSINQNVKVLKTKKLEIYTLRVNLEFA